MFTGRRTPITDQLGLFAFTKIYYERALITLSRPN